MKLIISDETLRDGEQQVGVNFSTAQKKELAEDIAKAGAHQIDLMPFTLKEEEILAKKLLKSKIKNKIYAATMLGKKYINHSYKLGFRNIILFSPLSKRLLKIVNKSEQQVAKEAESLCKYAKNKKISIIFAGEDATRANLSYVISFIKILEKYIDGFLICDTVGILTPTKTKTLFKKIISETKCPIGAHFHNDRGLAVENTIVAVKSGATIVSATFGGIGERAGNADLCDVLSKLKKDGIMVDGVNYPLLKKIRKKVYKYGGAKPAKPYSSRAFWHESGIHVHALAKDPLSFNPFLPEKYGKRTKIFFGKYSGISNYKCLFGNKLSDEQLIKIRNKIKELSYQNKKSYSESEVKKLVKGMKL